MRININSNRTYAYHSTNISYTEFYSHIETESVQQSCNKPCVVHVLAVLHCSISSSVLCPTADYTPALEVVSVLVFYQHINYNYLLCDTHISNSTLTSIYPFTACSLPPPWLSFFSTG